MWDTERLKTRKPLVRTKRKKKVPPATPPPAKVAATESIPTSSGLPVSPGMVTTMLPQSTPLPVPQPQAQAPPVTPVRDDGPKLTEEQMLLLDGLERGYTASKEVFKHVFVSIIVIKVKGHFVILTCCLMAKWGGGKKS